MIDWKNGTSRAAHVAFACKFFADSPALQNHPSNSIEQYQKWLDDLHEEGALTAEEVAEIYQLCNWDQPRLL